MLKEYRIPPLSGGKPKRVIMFLHGLGDSGAGGLLSIGEIWKNALPDCEFLCPDAPFPFEMAPSDAGGRQWFSLRDLSEEAILAGTREAAPHLNHYIDHVLQSRQIAANRLILVGFSQGTIMALYVAPRRADGVAAILGYSGLLIGAASLPVEKKSSPPVLLVHGVRDDVVPYGKMAEAESGLKRAGIPVTTLTAPLLAHGIDDVGVMEGLKFIRKIWTD